MYNTTYINDFATKVYYEYLKDPVKLQQVQAAYLKQYSSESNAAWLAFKESLDHFVSMKLQTDSNFIDSQEFKNYYKYIMETATRKYLSSTDGNQYTEYTTNIVLRNNELRKKILEKYASPSLRNNIEKIIKLNRSKLGIIYRKLNLNEKLNQSELDYFADYLYSSRNFTGDKGKLFIKYLLNNIKPQDGIKATPAIIGAFTSFLPYNYSLDKEVANTRFFISKYDGAGELKFAHSHGSRSYCVFERSLIDTTSLTSCDSLLRSRTNTSNDIYWFLMVSFHELTHQHQKREMLKGNLTSSGLSYAIRQVLNDYMPRIQTDSEKNYITDYGLNHDADEIEMQADAEAWRQTRTFIHQYITSENRHFYDSDGNRIDKWIQALDNEKAVEARRTFSIKKNPEEVEKESDLPENQKSTGLYYAEYDILNLERLMKEHPEARNKYPILKNIFDENGNFKVREIFTSNLAKNSEENQISGNSSHNSGLEILTYILNHRSSQLTAVIESGSLSKKELKKIDANIYHIIHESILKVRSFNTIDNENIKHQGYKKIKDDQFDETKSKFNFRNKQLINNMYMYYAKCIASGIRKRYIYRKMIKNKYNYVLQDDYKYYYSYLYEIYNILPNKEKEKYIKYIRDNYLTSDNTDLQGLGNAIIEYDRKRNDELQSMLEQNDTNKNNNNKDKYKVVL